MFTRNCGLVAQLGWSVRLIIERSAVQIRLCPPSHFLFPIASQIQVYFCAYRRGMVDLRDAAQIPVDFNHSDVWYVCRIYGLCQHQINFLIKLFQPTTTKKELLFNARFVTVSSLQQTLILRQRQITR